MKIEEHISELLFEHDCVIVPDFGGFVCNYAPANIDPVKHLFEPPGKKIMFNKGLVRNDGLLAHHISGKLKLPYNEALSTISDEVKRYKEVIEKDKRVTLENIGSLYLDVKGNLLFQQDNKLNYLADSFGLSAFYHLPIEPIKVEEEKVIPIYNERKKTRRFAAAAVIATLVVSAFCFTMLEKQTNMRFSSFSFYTKKAPALYSYTPNIYKEIPNPAIENSPLPEYIHITGTPVKVATIAANNTPTVTKNPATVAVSTASIPSVANTATATPGTFTIIIGSFGVKENADKLVNEFTKQGLQVSIVGKNPQGLYMVGYGKYSNHNDAQSERGNFMKKYSKDAWVKGN